MRVIDLVTRTLSSEHTTPARAYAALRAQTPGRSSFLIEAATGGPRRYSILGYRARGESVYPGGGNALALIAEDLVSDDPPRGFAERLSQSLVGYITYDAVNALQGIEPWADESDLARMMRDATVVVFDTADKTLTIAGRSKGAVDRCEWEMTHGPELAGLPALDLDAEPEHLDVPMADEVYAAKAAKARRHIADGAAESVVLARLFRAPMRGSDLFDVYRALCALDPAPYHFFLEFSEMPMAEGYCIAGSAAEGEVTASTTAVADPMKALEAAIPGSAKMGSPKDRVPAIIRELEPTSRGVYGGSVGYLSPGGAIELAVATTAVVLKKGYLEARSSVSLSAGGEPGNEAAEVRRAARPVLAAIRAAQELAKGR